MQEDAPPSDRGGSAKGRGAETNHRKVNRASCGVVHERAGADDSGDDAEVEVETFLRAIIGRGDDKRTNPTAL